MGRENSKSTISLGRCVRLLPVLVAVTTLCLVSTASAAPEPIFKAPKDGKAGSTAGRFETTEGIAADPNLPGHVYVVDRFAARIDELDPWGQFVKAWGWNVNLGSPAEQLQTCTTGTGCQLGSKGGGSGQISVARAITVDGAGNVYALESGNHRIQKFEPGGPGSEAKFVLTFGFKVNKTKEGGSEAEANVCTAASGDVCQAGSMGTGPGRLGSEEYPNRLAACPATNDIYVAEGGKIQRFQSNGSFKEEIKGGPLEGQSIQAIAVADEAGETPAGCDLYVALQNKPEVLKLKGSGPTAELAGSTKFPPESELERPKGLSVDKEGNLYVLLGPNPADEKLGPDEKFRLSGEPDRVQRYDATGKCETCGETGEAEEVQYEKENKKFSKVIRRGFDRSRDTRLESLTATNACEADNLYVSHVGFPSPVAFVRGFEPPEPASCPPPLVPPEVTAQFARSVETRSAELAADINPLFWTDTAFHVEYGTAPCSTGGCTSSTPDVTLTTKVAGNPLLTPPVVLEGLKEGVTYHYRFVAKSSGGGPADGLEAIFTTYRVPQSPFCPANQSFRTGPSALLPDCRAYEIVSPLDKEGGDIVVLGEQKTILPAVLSQSSTEGNRFAYGSYRSFGDAAAAPYTTQYIAARRPGVGWETHSISPPRGKGIFHIPGNFDTELRAFSPDLCSGWLQSFADPPLAPGAPAGYSDLYRRTDNECGGSAYEALSDVQPPNLAAGESFQPELLGLSADGRTAAFTANDVLAPGGTAGKFQSYASRNGQLRFLCILPGGAAWAKPCVMGGAPSLVNGRNREASVSGALSASGEMVFWMATGEGVSEDYGGGPGKIYLRENPFGEGAECGEPSSACTIAVSEGAEAQAGTSASQFLAAGRDGSRALFTTEPTPGEKRLYEFQVADKSTHLLASKVLGFLGASEDAARVYFASREDLDGPNAAEEGDANLYFREASGQVQFIGVLSAKDLNDLSPLAQQTEEHMARVSPDGLHAAFISSASLTGYDNTDASSQEPCGQVGGVCDAEVYLYDAGTEKLNCASCNPSGQRPQGRFVKEGSGGIQAAARIPVPENVLYGARVLSNDGSRLFFEAADALLPRDSNGREDVYQWEKLGAGGCSEASASYSPQNGGCVDLISSGQSQRNARFLDASPSGNDVFFTTLSSLVPQDPGLVDVYDARVEGGLPVPPGPPIECEGELCQSQSAAPEFQAPATATYEGPGDSAPDRAKQHKCPKGKQAVKKNGKTTCVKKSKKAKKAHRAGGQGK